MSDIVNPPNPNVKVYDQFTEASTDTNLESHTPNIGDQWAILRVTTTTGAMVRFSDDTMDNADDNNQENVVSAYLAKPDPTQKDQTLSIKIPTRQESASNAKGWGLFCKKTDADNYYFIEVYGNASTNQNFHIFKNSGGSVSVLGTTDNDELADNDVIKFECKDGSQKIFRNGVEVLATTDTDHDGDIGTWGWFIAGDTTFPGGESSQVASGWSFDNFQAEEFSSQSLSESLSMTDQVNTINKNTDKTRIGIKR